MASPTTAKLGAFPFTSITSIRVGPKPRTVGISANALSRAPIQTTDFVSGYRPVSIAGWLKGIDTQGETAAVHLTRLMHNLAAEVARAMNTLTIVWTGGHTDVYTVYKNDDVDFQYDNESDVMSEIPFVVTLNCLP